MFKLTLKESHFFIDKEVIGLPNNFFIDKEIKGYIRTNFIKVFKENGVILHATNKELNFKGIKFIGNKINGCKFTGTTFKYNNKNIEIKIKNLPVTQWIFSCHQVHILVYVNDKKVIIARIGKGISAFFKAEMHFSCTKKILEYFGKDDDVVYTMAALCWWVLFEQDR